tara:strand:+ start:195 stop:392 length:198 start_codon:yes stop_codon:yes gene_type:complete
MSKKKDSKSDKPKKKSVFTKKSSAGKGDKPRQGITQDEWEKKWEKIFRPKSNKKRDSIQVVRKRK